MEIALTGTGSILTKYLSACALVDGKIMVDCPNGVIKTMRRNGVHIPDIDICLITHFHADHIFDLPFLLVEQSATAREKDFVMIGPKGLYKRAKELFELGLSHKWPEIERNAKLKVVEVKDGDTFSADGYLIETYSVVHAEDYDAYGYIINQNGKKAGFTGDSALCDSVEKIVADSDITFADMSRIKDSKTHMGMGNFEYLMNKYPSSKIVPTHMTDEAREAFSKKHFKAPVDGDVFVI